MQLKPLKTLKDKIVIITGASSGIGRACAVAFANRNAIPVIAARQEEKLAELAIQLKKQGRDVLTVQADVRKEADCKNLVEKTIEKYGKIDMLINNAGISMRALFSELDLKVLKELMDTNFWGTVYCTKYALPYLLKCNGSVVGMSSILGKIPSPARTGYCASKYAMEGFLDTLRVEYKKQGLHVLTVRPGFTATNVRANALNLQGNPQGESPLNESKMMTPEAVAEKTVKAVLKRKRAINLSAETKIMVQVNKFFPGLVDRIVLWAAAKEPGTPVKNY